jgi:hypothetical protein
MIIDVSIIIINYNTFHLTCKCIESVLRFTGNIQYEIILVDNASTERDPDEFQQLFPQVIVIKNKLNIGFAKGNNEGIKIAKGNTILLLNSDAEVHDNVISELHKTLYTLPNVGVITCKLVYSNSNVQHQCGRFPSILLQILELLRFQKLLSKRTREKIFLGGFFDHHHSTYPDWIWGTFFMFKKEILKSFDGQKLPETYFMYQEDLEWCYLIQRNGYKIFYDASHKVLHHFSGSSPRADQASKRHQLVNNNLRDFLVRFHGKFYAKFFFTFQRLNLLLLRK